MMRGKTNILLFITSLCAAICIFYLDRNFFRLSLGTTPRLEYLFYSFETMLWLFFGIGVSFWERILRLVLAFAAGFLLNTMLNRDKRFLVLTWALWQTGIYAAYLFWFGRPLWIFEDPIMFFWRMLTIVPFLLGAALSDRISVLHRTLSSKGIKYAIIGLSVLALVLSAWPYTRIMTSAEYRAAREFEIEIHPQAMSVRKYWNPLIGERTVEFTLLSIEPDSLVRYYEEKLHWQIMPTWTYSSESGVRIEPGKWKWLEVPPDRSSYKEIVGYGSIDYVDSSGNVSFSIRILSKRKDPPNLLRVTLVSGPFFFKELLEHQER